MIYTYYWFPDTIKRYFGYKNDIAVTLFSYYDPVCNILLSFPFAYLLRKYEIGKILRISAVVLIFSSFLRTIPTWNTKPD